MSETTKTVTTQTTPTGTGAADFVVRAEEAGQAVLSPAGSKYEVQVDAVASAGVGSLVHGRVKVMGRKVWTIPAGGSFVSPLFGQPRMVQGRIKAVEGKTIIVQAGYPLSIELPEGQSAFDLKNGPLIPGVMVNVTVWPGAKFEIA